MTLNKDQGPGKVIKLLNCNDLKLGSIHIRETDYRIKYVECFTGDLTAESNLATKWPSNDQQI